MSGSKAKYDVVKLLWLLVSVMLFCTLAVAQEVDAEQEQTADVLTELELRMQKKVSIDFRDTPIEDVLRIMAEQADVDIVKSPTVTGNVTATLTEVPLEEALNNILAAHSYAFVTTKNMVRVAPLAEITAKSESLVNRIYRITYADVKEVEKSLNKFISARGSLSSNSGTSNVIVTDTESKIKAIDTFINEIDRITPQILVEARIYDLTTKDRLDLGIEWAAGRKTNYGASGLSDVGTDPTSGIVDPFIGGLFSGLVSETEGTSSLIRFGWLTPNVDIDALIKAQQQNIEAKLLANPRILVLDNESAQIRIISEIPYVELTESSSGGSFGTTKFREIGVELKVTPHIARDDMIRLRLIPEFSVSSGTVNVGAGSIGFPQPIVDRRTADTTLLVKNGQTVVLGGLRKKDVSKTVNKIPLLGDLPLVGMLFRSEGEDTVLSELVVFITPRIIENPILSSIEMRQLEMTEFPGPQSTPTGAELAVE